MVRLKRRLPSARDYYIVQFVVQFFHPLAEQWCYARYHLISQRTASHRSPVSTEDQRRDPTLPANERCRSTVKLLPLPLPPLRKQAAHWQRDLDDVHLMIVARATRHTAASTSQSGMVYQVKPSGLLSG